MRTPSLKSYKRFLFFVAITSLSQNVDAQRKLSCGINVSFLNSIGKDILKTYTSAVNPLSIQYFSRKKFEHPYINFLIGLSYPLSHRINFGIQSGLYQHFLEHYLSNIERTSVTIPLLATINYTVIRIKKNQLGINLGAGYNFFSVNDGPFKFKNGFLFNTSVGYSFEKRSTIKLGLQKESDNVSTYYIADYSNSFTEKFKYTLNRLSFFISYAYKLNIIYH